MTSAQFDRLSTGIGGLNEILQGGLIPERSYMLRGRAGSGKTLLGLHVLQEGIRQDEEGFSATGPSTEHITPLRNQPPLQNFV